MTVKAGHDSWPVLRALLVTWPKGTTQVGPGQISSRPHTSFGPPKIHPWKINMEAENTPLEKQFIFHTTNFRFFVNLQGCSFLEGKSRLVKYYDLAIGHIFIFLKTSISHLWKRNIIFPANFLHGICSSLEGISLQYAIILHHSRDIPSCNLPHSNISWLDNSSIGRFPAAAC